MFRTAIASKYRLNVLAGLLIFVMSAVASAASPTTELGKSQPNAPDLSLRAPWHVYVFQRDNVEYVQINDVNNNVRAAFANANGQTLVLPMGTDAGRVFVQQQPIAIQQISRTSDTVYRDNQVQVVIVPQPTGIAWIVQAIKKIATASGCSAETCTGVVNKF